MKEIYVVLDKEFEQFPNMILGVFSTEERAIAFAEECAEDIVVEVWAEMIDTADTDIPIEPRLIYAS